MKKILLIASLLSAQLLPQIAVAEPDVKRQEELRHFVRHDCGSCHGMTLKGGLGPALLPKTLAAQPESYLVTTILDGRKNTAMPPWKSMLSRDDATWIAKQLQQGLIQPSQMAQSKNAEASPQTK